MGREICTLLAVAFLSAKFIKNSNKNLPFQPIFWTKFDMLFEIAKSVEVVMIFVKTAILPIYY